MRNPHAKRRDRLPTQELLLHDGDSNQRMILGVIIQGDPENLRCNKVLPEADRQVSIRYHNSGLWLVSTHA
jgi:hypothetical protein